ncbi:hypothetical protein VUR80DRAFT_200 [Thermomyces stellatus]
MAEGNNTLCLRCSVRTIRSLSPFSLWLPPQPLIIRCSRPASAIRGRHNGRHGDVPVNLPGGAPTGYRTHPQAPPGLQRHQFERG